MAEEAPAELSLPGIRTYVVERPAILKIARLFSQTVE
jgi:hypothetical protein